MKKVLITGGGGFAARNLAEHLRKRGGYDVHAPGRTELDVLDAEAVKRYFEANRVDAVIHCASQGGTRKTGYDSGAVDVVACNLRMFFNLVRALPDSARMLTLGSGAEYDKRFCPPKVGEPFFDSHVPADAYGYSKYVISKYVEKTGNIACLRIFGLYGPGEDYTYKFISNAIVKNLLKMPIVINQDVFFDYLHVEDMSEAVERFINCVPRYKHYNLSPSASISLSGIADIINRISPFKSEIRILNPGLNREYSGDNSRFMQEFPGFEFTPYKDGIARLFKYYEANLRELDLGKVRLDPYLKACSTYPGEDKSAGKLP